MVENNEVTMAPIVRLHDGEATVNITWARQQGELLGPVAFDATDADVRRWVQEAIYTGTGIRGIARDESVTVEALANCVVERFDPTADVPYHRIFVRPKVTFGASRDMIVEAEAKCITCNTKWWVGADETKTGDQPACPKSGCYSFGVSTGKARRRKVVG